MLKNSRQIKYKNDTQEIITETARRMNVSPKTIQKAFQCYWQDIGIMFTYNLGYGINVECFCHLILYVQGIDGYCKRMEKSIARLHRMIGYICEDMNLNEREEMPEKLKGMCRRLNDYVTRLIMLKCSADLYEKEILAKFPKKYKPKRVYLDRLLGRLEEFYHIPLAEFPVQIQHPIQEVFVYQLQQKGLLPNPVFDIDQEVHLMRLHHLSENSLSEVQLPYTFVDQPN